VVNYIELLVLSELLFLEFFLKKYKHLKFLLFRGLEACVVDYVRPIIVGNILPKLTLGLLYLISATTLGGLIYYNVNDIGIGKTIRKFWAIKE
jgi:hypothetical protein